MTHHAAPRRGPPFERVLAFLQHLETARHNRVPTRNQRLAGLRTLFDCLGRRLPELLHACERVAAIPTKRTPLPETRFLDRTEIATLFPQLPREGRQALRDHALLLTLYNTGARAQEIADLRVEHVSHTAPPYVRLRGKGDKWRTCLLWEETARVRRRLLEDRHAADARSPVFTSTSGRSLTRFGIYTLVRRHVGGLERPPRRPCAGSRRTYFDTAQPSNSWKLAWRSMSFEAGWGT